MCGVIGHVGASGSEPAVPILLEGLSRLEYRGYDSAGLAVADGDRLTLVKVVGRVAELRAATDLRTRGDVGIAHTRWATHGRPDRRNAHPHLDAAARVAVVHNGIVENADELRAKLLADGVVPVSDTDSELIAELVGRALVAGLPSLAEAVAAALEQVQGTYGLVVLDRFTPGVLVAARLGSPLVVASSRHGSFVCSDVAALVRPTGVVTHLEDGDVVTVTAEGIATRTTVGGASLTGASRDGADGADFGDDAPTDRRSAVDDLGGFDTFLRKEIHEQPAAVRRALAGRLDHRFATARFGGIGMDARELRRVRRVKILGCGSSYYAGQMGAIAIEELARIPADAEPAAEFRYRSPVLDADTLYVAVSQSGETADTLLCVEEVQRRGGSVLGVVNVVGSSIARATGRGIFIHAGPEYSVASTKALTNIGVTFAMLGLMLGRVRDLSAADGARILAGLERLPDALAAVVALEPEIGALAPEYARARSIYFVGRHRGFPVAREGAQKLKEISYVHAEAYPASELKHGPLALVNEDFPTVVIIPADGLQAKNLATVEQIRARGGRVLVVTDSDLPAGVADHVVTVPTVEPELSPIVLTVALQILACQVAMALDREIDRPRNLAKSVTVE